MVLKVKTKAEAKRWQNKKGIKGDTPIVSEIPENKKDVETECSELWKAIVMLKAGGMDEVFPNLRANVAHHYIPCQSCHRLKYDTRNGVALHQNLSHYPHHRLSNPEITDKIVRKRGTEWANELYRVRDKYKGVTESSYKTLKYYQDIRDGLREELEELKDLTTDF